MKDTVKLTEGSILGSLTKLALPIIATSFVQMAYNMTDMLWLGNYDINGSAVAAAGTAGFFTWFGMAFIMLARVGAEVKVAQCYGKENYKEAKSYARTSLQLVTIVAILYAIILIFFRKQFIGFYKLTPDVEKMSIDYLTIVSLGLVSYFVNPILTAIFNGSGDSKTPFIMNTIGLVTNMILDPVLIFGLGSVPSLGVKGAAIATITAQFIVTICFLVVAKKKSILFTGLEFFKKFELSYVKIIVKLGFHPAVQSAFFTIVSMLIARVIANWGQTAIAVQKVGSQIEAISWMTAGGFQTALSAFVGQNYGAKKWDRIYKGYFAALAIVCGVGIFATCLLFFGAEPLFKLFIPGEEAVSMGIVYLKILALSQLFMCIEIATAGAFNGLGKTGTPAVVSMVLTALRLPGAIVLSSIPFLGLNGVWWIITISSILKGIILFILFFIHLIRNTDIMEWLKGKNKKLKV